MLENVETSIFEGFLNPAMTDMNAAICGLKISDIAAGRQLAEIGATLTRLQQDRKEKVNRIVEQSLPDLSSDTLTRLKNNYPGFVDQVVLTTFQEHRKIFGLFTSPGTANALILLKARLAHFLNTHREEELREIDKLIANFSESKQTSEKTRMTRESFIDSLEKLELSNGTTDATTSKLVKRIASQSRQLAAQLIDLRKRKAGHVASYMEHNQTPYDDSMWIYLGLDSLSGHGAQTLMAADGNTHSNYPHVNYTGQAHVHHHFWQTNQTVYTYPDTSTQYDSNNVIDNVYQTFNDATTGTNDTYYSDSNFDSGNNIQTDDNLGAYS